MNCPVCQAPMRKKEVGVYRYKESGLSNVVLNGGVLEATCPRGHEKLVAVQAESQLLQVIALTLLTGAGFLNGAEIRFIREVCQITQARLARSMRLARRETIAEWENERSPRRDLAGEFLLRAVLFGEFKEALDGRVTNHLTPSHFDLLHSFQEAFTRAHVDLLGPGLRGHQRRIEFRPGEKGIWTPERNAA